MTTESTKLANAVIRVADLSAAKLDAVRHAAVFAAGEWATIVLTGPGAVDCMQGLLTNDVVAPGSHGFVYGAVLTTKGMVVTDLWTRRDGGTVTLFVPPDGRAPLLEMFSRFVPPRLARVEDRTGDTAVFQVFGEQALDAAASVGLVMPDVGHALAGTWSGIACIAARPPGHDPFTLLVTCAASDGPAFADALAGGGFARVEAAGVEAARILSGWPRLGAEIDERTLPQEVRFDEINGLSYTKGCYTGQETVARLHFRGHTNRTLTGLEWSGEPDFANPAVMLDAKVVGRVTSALRLADVERWIGLAVVRREVSGGSDVRAAGANATTCLLPFLGLHG